MSKNNKRHRVGDRVTIYARGKKKIYIADFWHEGKHKRVSLDTCNKKVAIQRAVKIDAELINNKYSPPVPITATRVAVNKYIEFLVSEGRAPKTIVRYRGELDTFCQFCESKECSKLSQISMLLFDDYRADRRLIHAERTVLHESVVVKQFLKWCKERKLLSVNPLEDYRLEKPKHVPKGGPSLQQVNTILSEADEPHSHLIEVLAFSGMRVGELQHLLKDDLDRKENWIQIISRAGAETKTRESRKVPLHPRLQTLFKSIPKTSHKWLFTAPPSARYPEGDNWINPKLLNEYFKKVLLKLEIPAGRAEGGFSIHSLRHFFKTHCINCGIPKPVVDTWQGHKIDMSVGAQYYKLSDLDSQKFMQQVNFNQRDEP